LVHGPAWAGGLEMAMWAEAIERRVEAVSRMLLVKVAIFIVRGWCRERGGREGKSWQRTKGVGKVDG